MPQDRQKETDDTLSVYHGSTVIVMVPEIRKPNRTLDFGPGFYATTNKNQAEDFARKVYERDTLHKVGKGKFVSMYTLIMGV